MVAVNGAQDQAPTRMSADLLGGQVDHGHDTPTHQVIRGMIGRQLGGGLQWTEGAEVQFEDIGRSTRILQPLDGLDNPDPEVAPRELGEVDLFGRGGIRAGHAAKLASFSG